MGRAAARQAALRDSPTTAAPACAACPDKCHGLTPRGTSCHAPAAAPAAAARAATLTGAGAQYLEARYTTGKWPFAAPHMLDTGVSPP
jgi:hypothetical protein